MGGDKSQKGHFLYNTAMRCIDENEKLLAMGSVAKSEAKE